MTPHTLFTLFLYAWAVLLCFAMLVMLLDRSTLTNCPLHRTLLLAVRDCGIAAVIIALAYWLARSI